MRRIAGHEKVKSLPHPHIVEALIALTGSGHVSPARAPSATARAHCKALNQAICMRSRSTADINFLASPVTGAGVAVGRMEQLFLLGLGQGKGSGSAADLAGHVWGILQLQGQRIVKEGKTLESAEENLSHLGELAQSFIDKRLGILKALEIA
jgi:hypothetical protein